MRRYCGLATGPLIAAVLFAAASRTDAAENGTVVELGHLKSRTPATWKEGAASNRMRLAQFILPKAEGDKYDAEVVIFQGISGSAKENIDRWKGQFNPPQGQSINDAAKVSETKVADADVAVLDVRGTYKFKAQPFNPNAKEELRPDYRMVGVVFTVSDKPYHIRFVGPAKTVEKYKSGFDEWLKAFK